MLINNPGLLETLRIRNYFYNVKQASRLKSGPEKMIKTYANPSG